MAKPKKATRARAYLGQIKMLDTMIDEMTAEVAMLEEKTQRITPVLQDVPAHGGGTSDRVGDGVAAIVDLKREIDAEIDRFVALKQEARAILVRIRNVKYRKILSMRYFRFLSFREIGTELGCNEKNAHKINERALLVYEKLLVEREAQRMQEE